MSQFYVFVFPTWSSFSGIYFLLPFYFRFFNFRVPNLKQRHLQIGRRGSQCFIKCKNADDFKLKETSHRLIKITDRTLDIVLLRFWFRDVEHALSLSCNSTERKPVPRWRHLVSYKNLINCKYQNLCFYHNQTSDLKFLFRFQES